MDDVSKAVRALEDLLRGFEATQDLRLQGGSDTGTDAVGVTALSALAGRPKTESVSATSSSGSSAARVLGAIGGNLLGESLPGQVINQVTGTTSKSNTSVLGSVLGFLGKGFGIVPAVSALVKLFGGGGEDAPEPLPKYVAPAALNLDVANTAAVGTGLEFNPVRYAAGNLPSATVTAANEPASATQVVVQVNAMDSRSFMDHSTEIAHAVREAILNMHPLTDVVSDL